MGLYVSEIFLGSVMILLFPKISLFLEYIFLNLWVEK